MNEEMTADGFESFVEAMNALFSTTYRGIPVPDGYRIDWGRECSLALAWRAGVNAGLAHRETQEAQKATQ